LTIKWSSFVLVIGLENKHNKLYEVAIILCVYITLTWIETIALYVLGNSPIVEWLSLHSFYDKICGGVVTISLLTSNYNAKRISNETSSFITCNRILLAGRMPQMKILLKPSTENQRPLKTQAKFYPHKLMEWQHLKSHSKSGISGCRTHKRKEK